MNCLLSKRYLALAILFVSGNLLQTMAAIWTVTDFGARGDAVQTRASCVSNSTQVTLVSTNQLSNADAGKLIELFGAGATTAGTNHQDLIATILAVTNGDEVTISAPAGVTAAGINCTFGTQNAGAFQNCINACQGTDAVVMIPAGRYLLVPTQVLDPGFVMPNPATLCLAVSISKGGIRFQGDTPADTILLGNGAWILNNGSVQRGVSFGCVGPVTNNAPLVFTNLTFDGGVQVGNLNVGSGPANPLDGTGWDITHDAVVDMGLAPLHASKQFINCVFAHWRGEMVKSVATWDAGFIGVTNCVFQDGDGSGYNFNWTPHVINGCLFSNLNMAMEFYVGTMQTNSYFENSVVTNTRIGIVLVGGLTNHPSPGYSIVNNTISASDYEICLGPARNVTISGNTLVGGTAGVATDGFAYQGTDCNQNILVQGNQIINAYYVFMNGGIGQDLTMNMTWMTNCSVGCHTFAAGYGWGSNIVFAANRGQGSFDSSQLTGQWYLDDISEILTPYQDNSLTSASLTNTVSYAFGTHHQLYAKNNQAVFLLDNSHPERIPPAAELMLTNIGQYPAPVYPMSVNLQGSPLMLPAGGWRNYAWSNTFWVPIPSSPSNLRISTVNATGYQP
jgi:hypothetical protein